MISIKGHIQNNNYVDKDDNKVYSYEMIADQISFMQPQKVQSSEEKEESIIQDLINAE